MGCQVLNVGAKDLAGGLSLIQEFQQQANFPFISANIRAADQDQLLFPATTVVETPDKKIGFIGVTSGNPRLRDFDFDDPVEAASKAIQKLKGQVDVVVILANVDDATEKLLYENLSGVDFLIRSQTARRYQAPKMENGIVVIRNGNQGKYAGVLDVKLSDPAGGMKDISAQMKRIKFADSRLDAMLKGVPEGVALEDHYAADEKRLQLITRLKSERADNEDLIKKLGNTYYFNPVALDDKVADTPEVAEIVAEYMVDHTVEKGKGVKPKAEKQG
jgi:2',3'-cyclic-nucleotide 2'-phosphodiesterase (5'-nucleotidase family)